MNAVSMETQKDLASSSSRPAKQSILRLKMMELNSSEDRFGSQEQELNLIVLRTLDQKKLTGAMVMAQEEEIMAQEEETEEMIVMVTLKE